MVVEVDWTFLEEDDNPLWNEQMCLYAYLHPSRDWLMYVGKSDFSTVRRRLSGDHKRVLFSDIRRTYGVDEVRVLHGELLLESGARRSSALLTDVESLLIKRLQPFGNIQSRQSRIWRSGLGVHCVGDWPFRRWRFHDVSA